MAILIPLPFPFLSVKRIILCQYIPNVNRLSSRYRAADPEKPAFYFAASFQTRGSIEFQV
jgi:hypothetical protein